MEWRLLLLWWMALKPLHLYLYIRAERNNFPCYCGAMNRVNKEECSSFNSSIITSDQLVFALYKQILLIFSSKFQNFLHRMGDLRIEMAFKNLTGNWLEENGWADTYLQSEISSSGRINSFLKVTYLKRTLYAPWLTFHILSLLRSYTIQNRQ